MPNEPISLIKHAAPDFITRLRLQEEVLAKRMRKEIDWGEVSGDYGCVTLLKDEYDFGRTQVHELTGLEQYFSSIIAHQFQDKYPDKPVIFLDLGGMAGLSWCRLANQYKDLVAKGHLAFVVTNLAFRPEQDLKRLTTLTKEQLMFIKTNQHLIHYIQTDARSISKQTVLLNGQTIPLQGNVDLIHESLSVSDHSLVPEWDTGATVSELASPQCIYLSTSGNPIVDFTHSQAVYDQRVEGKKLALLNIASSGFLEVSQVEQGARRGSTLAYTVLRKPESGPITYNYQPKTLAMV